MIRTNNLHEFNWTWAFIECVHPNDYLLLKEQCTGWGNPLEHFPNDKREVYEEQLPLIKSKYDLNKMDEHGRNFLYFYLDFSRFQHNFIFQQIASETTNWNAHGNNRNTIFHKLVARYETKHEDWLALAIERGANINQKNALNRTPLDDALMYRNEKAIQLLLSNGATWGHYDMQAGHTLANLLFFTHPQKDNLVFWQTIDPADNTPLVNDPHGTGGMLNSAIERELWDWTDYIVQRMQERVNRGQHEENQLAGLKIALKQLKKQDIVRYDLNIALKELILRTQISGNILRPPKVKV